jgi:phosphatidylethanolamine/phosphatidyl-N-methylethanolamine N-methyltransferase
MRGDSVGASQEYYAQYFSKVQRSGIQGWGNALLDRALERSRRDRWLNLGRENRVLEVGASSGEHLTFVDRESFSDWVCLDLKPGISDPWLRAALEKEGICFIEGDVHAIPFSDAEFDEIVSTCLLHHLDHVEEALLEMRRVVRAGGTITIGMPTDPGILNRAVKRIVTFPQMRRIGIRDPRLVYAREHRNSITSIIALIAHVFSDDEVVLHYRPFWFPTWNGNLFVIVSVRLSDADATAH